MEALSDLRLDVVGDSRRAEGSEESVVAAAATPVPNTVGSMDKNDANSLCMEFRPVADAACLFLSWNSSESLRALPVVLSASKKPSCSYLES